VEPAFVVGRASEWLGADGAALLPHEALEAAARLAWTSAAAGAPVDEVGLDASRKRRSRGDSDVGGEMAAKAPRTA
jgi:hypothetical protein